MEEPPMDGADFDDTQFIQDLNKHGINNGSSDHKQSSSSSDSDIDNYTILHASSARKDRFARKKPLHLLLGDGKCCTTSIVVFTGIRNILFANSLRKGMEEIKTIIPADIVLWRNKHLTGGMFGAATLIWLLFECFGYHLLTFLCHSLMLSLTTFFVWSKLSSFINLSPPKFPNITISMDSFAAVLVLLTQKMNYAFKIFHNVASGKDLKKFFMVIAVLWIISVIGRWFNFLTLFYLVFVMLLTVPILYEKNEDVVDAYAEKAWGEIKKQYAVLDEKFLHKVPMLSSHKVYKKH